MSRRAVSPSRESVADVDRPANCFFAAGDPLNLLWQVQTRREHQISAPLLLPSLLEENGE